MVTSGLSTLDPTLLVAMLREQRDLYSKLKQLADRQRSTIRSDRPDQLLTILRERQMLVAALAKLNDRLAPYRRNWDALYSTLPEPARRNASELLREINDLLRVILTTDHEDSALLSARKKMVAAELTGMVGGRTAHAAYAKHESVTPAQTADLSG